MAVDSCLRMAARWPVQPQVEIGRIYLTSILNPLHLTIRCCTIWKTPSIRLSGWSSLFTAGSRSVPETKNRPALTNQRMCRWVGE
jgi:hypothetical protein